MAIEAMVKEKQRALLAKGKSSKTTSRKELHLPFTILLLVLIRMVLQTTSELKKVVLQAMPILVFVGSR